MHHDIIKMEDMTAIEQQIFADYLLHEQQRHKDDVVKINIMLEEIEYRYGIKPRTIYVKKWIEI
jgi:poly(3-hydroxybutyrate) depolymerase